MPRPLGFMACKGSAIEFHKHKYDIDPVTGCWIWNAALRAGEYSYLWHNGKASSAHIVFWEERNGPVPEGLILDHFVCDTKRCVNPEHVKPVTNSQNVQRGKPLRRKKSHGLLP
jgi:hypothetical protein